MQSICKKENRIQNIKKVVAIMLAVLLVVTACFCVSYKADAYVVKGNTTQNIKVVQQRLSNLGY